MAKSSSSKKPGEDYINCSEQLVYHALDAAADHSSETDQGQLMAVRCIPNDVYPRQECAAADRASSYQFPTSPLPTAILSTVAMVAVLFGLTALLLVLPFLLPEGPLPPPPFELMLLPPVILVVVIGMALTFEHHPSSHQPADYS